MKDPVTFKSDIATLEYVTLCLPPGSHPFPAQVLLAKIKSRKGRPNRRPALDDQALSQLQPTAALLGMLSDSRRKVVIRCSLVRRPLTRNAGLSCLKTSRCTTSTSIWLAARSTNAEGDRFLGVWAVFCIIGFRNGSSWKFQWKLPRRPRKLPPLPRKLPPLQQKRVEASTEAAEASVEAVGASMEVVYYFYGSCVHGSFHCKSRVLPRKVSPSLWKQLPWKLRAASMEDPFISSMVAFTARFQETRGRFY